MRSVDVEAFINNMRNYPRPEQVKIVQALFKLNAEAQDAFITHPAFTNWLHANHEVIREVMSESYRAKQFTQPFRYRGI